MEIIKNCIEELVSVKHVSVSNTPEVNRNLLLEPVLLPKESNSSSQNIDPVRMGSADSRLVEKGEEMLGEIQMQLQTNNATIVGLQKEMHFCAFSNTETKEIMHSEFLSHPKAESGINEQQLLQDKCSCDHWSEDKFQIKTGGQTAYLNSTVGTVQPGRNKVSRNEDSDTHTVTCVPPYEEVLLDVEHSKASKVISRADLPTSAQFTETVQDVDILCESSPKNEDVTELVVPRGIQNSPNCTTISEIGTKKCIMENSTVPSIEVDYVETTKALPDATEIKSASTTTSSVKYENAKSHLICASLETEYASTDKAPPVDGISFILEAKDGSCLHHTHTDQDESLVKTSNFDISLPLLENKNPLELEKTKLINNTESATMAKHIPSLLKNTETFMAKSPVVSAENNDLLVHEMRNHSEEKTALASFEIKEVSTITLAPPTSPSEDECLPKGSPPAVKPDNNCSAILSSSVFALANNSFVFEDNISLDNMTKLVPNSEDESLLDIPGLLSDKQEATNRAGRSISVIASAGADYIKICSSVSTCENMQAVKKKEVFGHWDPLSAADFGSVDSESFLESGEVLEIKVPSGPPEMANIRTGTLPCSEETKDTALSCSMRSGISLVKENLPFPTVDCVFTCKPVSPTTACSKITAKCSPVCEIIDVALNNIDSLPFNSEVNKGKISPEYESSRPLFGSISETVCQAPFLTPVAYNVEDIEPVKMVLDVALTAEEEKEHSSALGQANRHYLAAATSETPVEIDAQAITALFTKSSSQFSEEALKDVETGKQVQIKSQVLTVLFKKADEIVDAVLHLATEEIRSKQAAGVCQTNNIKDSLLGTSLQKDQKTQKMLPESKEIQLRNSSLKHYSESCIGKLPKSKRKDIVGTDNQDEKIQFDIVDKIDLDSSIALKAKEIIDDVINAAKQKLACDQQEEHLGKDLSQSMALGSKTEASERLTADGELTAKLPKIIEAPLHLNPLSQAVTHNVMCKHEVTNSSSPLYVNSKDDSGGVPNVLAYQIRGELSDSRDRIETSTAEIGNGKNSKGISETTHVADDADSTTKYHLYAVNGEAVMTEEQLPSCPTVPANVPSFNSNVNVHICLSSKSKGECDILGKLGSSVGRELPQCICKEVEVAAVVTEEPHEKCYEIDSEMGYDKMKEACAIPQDTNGLSPQFSISESSVMNNSAKIDLNADFACEEAALTRPGLAMSDVLKENYLENLDGENSPKWFAASPPKEWGCNSSFTILYEGALQDESFTFSTEKPEHPFSPLPDLSPDNIQHLLVCETAKSKFASVQPYEESSQLNEILDNTCSESFMAVEAKRCRVYPFSLSPIYEDDSSQEDLLSTDVSPGCPSEKSRDGSNYSLSVLSLLQSVSERLKTNNHCCEEEEELAEEDRLEYEKEVCIPSHLLENSSTEISENIHERNWLSRHSKIFSSEACSSEKALSFSSIQSASSDPSLTLVTKPFSKSLYYDYLQSARSYSGDKGTRFGSHLLPRDQQPEDDDLQQLSAFQVHPLDKDRFKWNPRPGKMVISDDPGNKNKHEIYHDVLDATAWVFAKAALIRVVRGCWILYEKPNLQGQKYALEEGEKVLNNIWNPHSEKHQENFTIGSIRQVEKNCSIPEIELYPQAGTDQFPIYTQSSVANLEELGVQNPTLSVKAGIWLAYSDVNYKGEVMVLEENHSPGEISAADVKSFRPLKMGGLKVQMPMNIKLMIYEKPHFGGWCKELSENVDCVPTLFRNADDFQGIGSVHVIGGIWVAYEKERYKGQQYLLEEGEYEDWQSWGGVNSILLSFRFLQADFMESKITLFEMDEENGKLLEIVNQEIPDLEQAGFGLVTRSVSVKCGVWVAYEQKYFCGEQYILEKGKYKCFFDWGGSSETIMSIRPIKLEPLGNHEPTHWLKAFSKTHFQGKCIDFTTEVAEFTSFTPCSFKVLRGCWLLHYQGETADNQCVLEEDLYTDLASCGCPAATVKSLKPIEYVFAEPFISLFALDNCEGRELHLQEASSSVLNKDLHFLTQSVWVRSGLWIAYEGSNFLGKQLLLKPSRISNWTQLSGWKVIGSIRPVKQPAVYFRIKNRSQDKYITVAGNLMDARAASVCLAPLNGKNTQIWRYNCGLIKSKVNDACLDVIGGRDAPGAKVALWVEHGKPRQKWTLNKDGTINSYLSDQLVLDIKGGYYYDRNYIIVNQRETSEYTQRWDFEIL
ncbi:very large A-kinase anchor protein isoform X2 [Hemicordylus capensis]|nr:very large A-kinase anchor protein isoform X2 [Hemicordylus capensis]